jgi:hypothetical protein
MAIIPPLKLTRDQLTSFLQDFEQIKQFENLFATVQSLAPIVGTDFEFAADTALATANESLALISALAQDTAVNSETANARASQALALIAALAQEAAINSWNADCKAVQALDSIERVLKLAQLPALAPVIQNNNSVTTDYVDFRTEAPYPADFPGRIYWNRDDGTLDLDQPGATVLQIGQELQYYAKNTSGGLVANGTPVMFTGVVGASAKLEFGLAIADGSVPADYMMGVATQNIPNNEFGYITSFGVVRGFNTTGTPYGQVWTDGDLLYFSATTPGGWTNVQPAAPAIDVPVAVVLNAGPGGSGSIFVRMTVAEALSRLQDVFINGTPQDFDILLYDSTQTRWENKPASAVQVLNWMSM